MAESQTNNAWNSLFTSLQLNERIANEDIAFISAEEIKKFGKREPRLMCKFDNKDCRPQIFKDKHLTILPIKNGEWALISGDGYQSFPNTNYNINYVSMPGKRLETLPINPRSESQVIDLAFASGLLSRFLEDDSLKLTIRGRLRTKPFDFYFRNNFRQLSVDGVQVEIDAGYEGQKIYLIEAKMGQINDFLIRQLYYPYRMWHEENISKEVIPILINYANNTISISEYTFDDFYVYSSISPIKYERFSFDENPLKFNLLQILESTKKELQEPNIPFPQADDITKVIDTIDLISWGYNSKQSIAKFWQIDPRQADYYTNAASYLGFIYKKDNGCWNLTSKGNEFVNYPTTKRNYLLCSAILSKPVFNEIGTSYLDKGKIMPDKQSICDVLQNYVQLSGTTPPRRVQTIKSWIDYLGNLDNTVSY
ncbi:TPA: hypothetical protein RGN14_002067 [Legionella pneumophila]|nr:hypothetical protein [Legionella pneumophila]HDU8292057.1 hypothetical protein [Legionella pneumophila]